MRILIISNLYPPFQLGGYEIGCNNIANGLKDLDHEVLVLTSANHARSIDQQTDTRRSLRLNSFQPFQSPHETVRNTINLNAMVTDFTNTSILLDTLKSYKPDCVYLFNLVGIGGLGIIDALNNLDYPWVLHLMDRVPEALQAGIPQTILELFNANNGVIYESGTIVSMSKHLIKEIETLCMFKFKTPPHLVPGWADSQTEIFKRRYRTSGDIKFVTAGAVHAHKGIDLIIEATALLKLQSIENFSLDIYGEGLIAHYVDMCKQTGTSDKVSFLGSRTQTELVEVYKKADVFLFPTWEREPFGFAPLEAVSVGCVPIITNNCGLAERLVNNVHCIKVHRNKIALSEAMKSVCEHTVSLEGIGQSGQKITRADLSFRRCLRQIESILVNVSESPRNRRMPNWKDTNVAFLKHNLANRFLYSS